jgi:HrpA-like RNA helicase
MSALPVDLRLAKMLVLACVFRALDPVLTIAAMLSSKPLFSGPMEKREEMKKYVASPLSVIYIMFMDVSFTEHANDLLGASPIYC